MFYVIKIPTVVEKDKLLYPRAYIGLEPLFFKNLSKRFINFNQFIIIFIFMLENT